MTAVTLCLLYRNYFKSCRTFQENDKSDQDEGRVPGNDDDIELDGVQRPVMVAGTIGVLRDNVSETESALSSTDDESSRELQPPGYEEPSLNSKSSQSGGHDPSKPRSMRHTSPEQKSSDRRVVWGLHPKQLAKSKRQFTKSDGQRVEPITARYGDESCDDSEHSGK